MRSAVHGAVVLGGSGTRYLADGRVEGDDPLAGFSPTAAQHLMRTDGFADVADIMVGSFHDPELDDGCAFEEPIGFHGGIGGEQTRPFILYPVGLPLPERPIIGAAAVHALLKDRREPLNGMGGRALVATSTTSDKRDRGRVEIVTVPARRRVPPVSGRRLRCFRDDEDRTRPIRRDALGSSAGARGRLGPPAGR